MGGLLDTKNDNNNNNIEKDNHEVCIPSKILGILQPSLDMTNGELNKIEEKSSSTKDAIFTVLKKKKLLDNPKIAIKLFGIDSLEYYSLFNKSIFNNKDVLLAGLQNDIDIYKISIFSNPINKLLGTNFNENKSLADIILKKYIKNNTNFHQIQKFIKDISGDNVNTEKILMKMYEKHLKMSHKLHSNDVKNKALLLFSHNELNNVYSLFVESKILNQTSELDKKVAKIWSLEISESLSNKKIVNTQTDIIQFLISKINIENKYSTHPEVLGLLEGIYNVLKLNIISEESDIEVNLVDTEIVDDGEKNQSLDSDKFDYCNDDQNCSCTYDYSSGGSYLIETGSNKIVMSEMEYKQFSPDSLENYIKLSNVLTECGLGFMLENKYKSGFFLLMQSRHTGFSPKGGKGFTSFHRLEALNVIANMIGIPKNLYGNTENVGMFSDVALAVDALKSIYFSGEINHENVTKGGGWMLNNSAAEVKLQEIGILGKNGGFVLSKAEEIMKEGGYSRKYERSTDEKIILDNNTKHLLD